MQKTIQHQATNQRKSGIELLKIFGIILVVISHVIQTLHSSNSYISSTDYIVNLSVATTNVQHLILALLRYSGMLGNTIFFVCSAWFLLDSNKVNKKKLLQMLMDVWVISVSILIAVFIIRRGNISFKLLVEQLFPTTYENNWYITCYMLFYAVHPLLNSLLHDMPQKTLLKTTLVLIHLYVFINFVLPGQFFSSSIVLWITIYFAIAYIKFYLADLSNNTKLNLIMLGIGFAGNIGIVLLTNFLGLRIAPMRTWILRWNLNCSPFLILIAISLLNIARNVHFKNKAVNYISGLSLLIYVIHENELLRTYYRPMMWSYIYNRFGYDYILLWTLIMVLLVFSFGLIMGILYKCTIQKIVTRLRDRLYPVLQRLYRKIETRIFKLH